MRYFLLDANVLVPLYVEENATIHRRVMSLLARRANEDAFLYVPQVCIPEVLKALARKSNDQDFPDLKEEFSRDLSDDGTFYPVELSQRHVRLCDTLYRPAASRSFRRGSPPSAADLLIIAMGLDLARIHGRDRFAIVTAERPLYDLCVEDPARMPRAFHIGERDVP